MAPKRTARVAVGSVVRTRRTIVQETVQVSVVRKTWPKEQKVVKVEVRDEAAPEQQQPAALKGAGETAATPAAKEQRSPAGEEEEGRESRDEKTQPPLESEESLQREWRQEVGEKRRGGEEPRADGGFKGEIERDPAAAEEMKAEGGNIEEVEKMGEEEKKKRLQQQRRRRRKTRAAATGARGYKRYVFKVLKQVHPELRVSSMAMTVLDSLMNDMFERLVEEASQLCKHSGKATLSSREIQGAVRLVLPGELGKHAVAEGCKAVANYMAADKAGA